MEQGRPSQTAMTSALMRAAHPFIDGPPYIFEDPWAARLIGLSDETALRAALDALEAELSRRGSAALCNIWIRTARLCGALRDRVADEQLSAAVARGVRQCVILGAGFDSCALRRIDLPHVRIFEVDHPATQAQKMARLHELGIATPANLNYVPIDFETTQSLLAQLRSCGYNTDEPAFFAWLGVIWYMSENAIDQRLREIATSAAGSEVVFDYVVTEELMPPEGNNVLQILKRVTSSRGEPGRTYFAPDHLLRYLRTLGFDHLLDVGSELGNTRYCALRTDGLRIPEFLHVCSARVSDLSM
jgi:methyltransferase (TIGR00027 family)